MPVTSDDLGELFRYLTPAEQAELQALVAQDMREVLWRPLPGPQTMALNSKADVIGYGGAAGGGKTELALGKALTQHHEVLIMRREATQLKGIIRRLERLLGGRDGYNGQDKRWASAGPRRVDIEFGSCPNPGDETKHQGNPHDLLCFDEAANFLESQVNFLLGWNRTTRAGVRSQALLTFNPPTSAEGRWIVEFFGPWINKRHPLYPTPPGEIRYVVTVPQDNDTYRYEWVKDARPCVIAGGKLVFDFNPDDYRPEDIVTPQSRTFIPSRISDNPYLARSGYMRVLQAMPEPLRSQMLYGDFEAGMTDDPWQVIPTAWVNAAMARWRRPAKLGEMLTLGVDVARGGKDSTTIARKHRHHEGGFWFDEPLVYPGSETPDGPAVVGQVLAAMRDSAVIIIDVIGVGASPYDFLRSTNQPVLGLNVSERATTTDRTGRLTFANMRSQMWWLFREALDPANNVGLVLPPDEKLAAELCTPRWSMQGTTIQVESREEIVKRVGRSPDRATAYVQAYIDVPKRHVIERGARNDAVLAYNPLDHIRSS
jgi:hypothetical protein